MSHILMEFVSPFPDPDIVGYNVFDDLTDDIEPTQKPNKNAQDAANLSTMTTPTPTATTTNTPEKNLKTPPKRKPLRRKSKQKDAVDAAAAAAATTPMKSDAEEQLGGGAHTGGDSDAELFEIEESDTPLIPLYHLRDEGTTKWVLLSDLCYLLKVKSKDTLLKLVSVLVTGWKLELKQFNSYACSFIVFIRFI